VIAAGIAGAVILAVSLSGLIFSWGSTKASPSTAVVASSTPTAPAVSPPSTDAVATWQALLAPFVTGMASGDTGYLFDHLDPAVLQVYGADQCRAALAETAPDPTSHYTVLSVSGPAPWPYTAAGQTVTVSDVYAIEANVTLGGQMANGTHHFTLRNGALNWFTKCTTAATAGP
jgi:hypothetical protein